ncbi:MAG: hypothetical protein V1899_03095 [Planctomycetota bacterium]
MATLGPNDLKQIALPAGFDTAYLSQLTLKDGRTYDEYLNDLASALSIANQGLMADPLVASLCSTTDEASLEYQIGVSNGFQPHTEYGLPDGKRAVTTGTMLPLIGYDRMLDWTWDYLRSARSAQLDANVDSAIADLKDKFQNAVLSRLFKGTYDAVGASGKSMPLADAGTADSAYIPVNRPERASAFASSHDHIAPYNGISQAGLEAAVANLWEHGYDAPFTLLIAQADTGSWSNTTNVTGWVKRGATLIRYGTQTDIAAVDSQFIGAIETSVYGEVQVIANARIPTAFWGVYKSYGAGDARNPLKIRQSADYGLGAVLMSGRQFPIKQFPLEGAMLFLEFGVGVADRVGAAVYKNTAGAWSEPSIA